jgi:hypothetical protein
MHDDEGMNEWTYKRSVVGDNNDDVEDGDGSVNDHGPFRSICWTIIEMRGEAEKGGIMRKRIS